MSNEKLDDINRLKKEIKEIDEEILETENEHRRLGYLKSLHGQLIRDFTPILGKKAAAMYESYLGILDNCIANHNAPETYLDRAILHFLEGNQISCLEDIKKLFEITPDKMLSEDLASRLELTQGKIECEVGLFNEALQTLSHYIEKHPHNKEAFLERAITLFQKEDFHSALEDFATLGLKENLISPTLTEEVEFSAGVIKGITLESTQVLANFIPSSLALINALSHGLWALATSPNEVTREMYYACQNALAFVKQHQVEGVFQTLFPEFKELVEKGDKLSHMEQGELLGKVVGRFGTEFLLLKGTAQGVKIYRDLKRANSFLTLERMSSSVEAKQILINNHKQWSKKIAPIIEELKTSKHIDKELYNIFKNQPLSELQVRHVLHQAGFKTFPRPKGVPSNWEASISRKNGGMRYRLKIPGKDDAFELGVEVRVMPGNPNAKWPSQKQPYVMHNSNGKFLDKHGNIVLRDSEPAHIPLGEYDFN
ncbi:MAG: hypothetical protein KDK76_03325, partial [Chlamydiia bacterium]|nr:hypothetical protein [Chlamydiia bacterium]